MSERPDVTEPLPDDEQVPVTPEDMPGDEDEDEPLTDDDDFPEPARDI